MEASGVDCLFTSGAIMPRVPCPCPDCGRLFTAEWCLEFHDCEVRRGRLGWPESVRRVHRQASATRKKVPLAKIDCAQPALGNLTRGCGTSEEWRT